jgi:serine/threonine protein kinase/tetratricopeptide (TPR) repeat protein
MIGQELLYYRVSEKIGEGGQGVVYKAIDTTLDRTVVIKILPQELTERTSNLARFEREAKLASSLDHPNICTIFGFHKADGVLFIAMQYVAGKNVRQLVAGRPLELRSALSIGIQVADALAAAHERGIIHRDIKAGNVMVTETGTVKVLDFGLAKLIETPNVVSNDPQITELGVPYGTSTYAAPEQAQGFPVDHRADIFSAGVLLYEMLVGTWPFRGRTVLDVRYAVVNHTPTPLAEARGESSPYMPQLQQILDRALAKEPRDRYQKMEDLRDDLQSVLREIDGDCGQITHSTGSPLRVTPRHLSSHGGRFASWTRRKVVLVAGIALLIACAALTYSLFRLRPSSVQIDSLAVLPFANGSGDTNKEYLSDGITEGLINSLSQVPNLKVKSRNTVFQYKGRETDPTKIGRELGVGALVFGRVVQRGDALAVSVELIDAQDDSQIWGEQYDRKLSDVVGLPREISYDVSQRLRSHFSGAERPLVKEYVPSAEAYQLYLQGRYNWNKRTSDGLQKGIEYFDKAIAKDQNYSLAYAGLADCYALLNVYNVASANESYPKAETAANKALGLDEAMAESHTSLAFVSYRYQWKWAEAEKHFKRAIDLNPNYATAHQWYSAYLAATGRHLEAINEIRRARELEPFSLPIYADLVRHLYFARRYDEAGKECLKLLELDQGFARGHVEFGQILEQKGLHDAAIVEFNEALSLSLDNVTALSGLGHAQAMAGKKGEALKILNRLNELSKRQYVSPFQTAVIYAGLGDSDKAIEGLEKSRAERFNWLPFILVDPIFDSLRAKERFTRLANSIGLKG